MSRRAFYWCQVRIGSRIINREMVVKRVKLPKIVSGCLSLLMLVLVCSLPLGCNPVGDRQDEPGDEWQCPDLFITATVVLSSAIDSEGEPAGIATRFAADTEEIFCTFTLSDTLCCSTTSVRWFYNGEFISLHEFADNTKSTTISLKSPEGGFVLGQYRLTIHLDDVDLLADITFVVE